MSIQPSSKVLSPGELSIGQVITVLSWEPVVHDDTLSPIFSSTFGGTSTKTTTDQSYCGDVLHVKAIDLPFVAVDVIVSKWGGSSLSDRPTSLDTRRVKLMELSPEYVAAMQSKTITS